jgi:hypothetical protein
MNTEIWERLNTRSEVVLFFSLLKDFDRISKGDFDYFQKHFAIDERRFGDALRKLYSMGLLKKSNRSEFEITDSMIKARSRHFKK